MTESSVREVAAVGAVIRDGDRILLVQRGHPPGLHQWSIPGGRVEAGETDAQALVREVAEETGLAVTAGDLLGEVRRAGPTSDVVYVIRDYTAYVVGATDAARPGDDAADLRWVPTAELAAYDLVDQLLDTLTAWGTLRG